MLRIAIRIEPTTTYMIPSIPVNFSLSILYFLSKYSSETKLKALITVARISPEIANIVIFKGYFLCVSSTVLPQETKQIPKKIKKRPILCFREYFHLKIGIDIKATMNTIEPRII